MLQHPQGNFSWVELGTPMTAAAAKNFYSSVFGWSITRYPMGPDQVYTIINLAVQNGWSTSKWVPNHRECRHTGNHTSVLNSADETAAKARELRRK